MATREEVTREARTWLGTPYHHRARIKGVGVDCAQLPAAVYGAVGMIPDVAPDYSPDWHMHSHDERYLDWVLRLGGREIDEAQAGPGDFIIWRWGRAYSHGGILLDLPWVVHAFMGVGVTLDRIDQHAELLERPRRIFTLWDG